MIIPVWMEAEIGGVSKDVLLNPLDEQVLETYPIGAFAKDVIWQNSFTTLHARKVLRFARRTLGQIGCSERSTFESLKARILGFGCLLCPAEAAVYVQRQLGDRQKDVLQLLFLMEQIADSKGCKRIFKVNKSHDFSQWWLHAICLPPDKEFPSDTEIVFVLPDKK